MKKYLLILAVFDSFCHGTRAQLHDDDFCFDGSELAVLDFFTDSHSEQNGWSLVCDGNELRWDIKVGTLKKDTGSRLTESSCIPKTTSCSFTFLDAGGDGLAGEGFLTFRYGATTHAIVNYGESISFSEISACFGPRCNGIPLAVADAGDKQGTPEKTDVKENQEAPGKSGEDDHQFENDGIFCRDDEKNAALDILLDENPLEIGWSLVCDSEVHWTVAAGTIDNKGGSWISENTCVPNSQTCTFILTDTTGDGLSSKGYYALRHGATTVTASAYGSATPFSEKVSCFGPNCTQPPLEQIQDESDASNMNTETTITESQNFEQDERESVARKKEDEVTDSVDAAMKTREDASRNNFAIIAAVLGGIAGFVCIFSSYLLFFLVRQKKNYQGETAPELYDQEKPLGDDTDDDSRVENDTGDSGLLLHVLHGDSTSVTPSMKSEEYS
eukprot:scaffold75_cov165-Amphora_coffeaeformis.AAC.5